MLEHGAVQGSRVYQERHRARWQARALIALLVELRLHERPELREHTDRVDGGWVWYVQHVDARSRASSPEG
jgi:hypothetical protein